MGLTRGKICFWIQMDQTLAGYWEVPATSCKSFKLHVFLEQINSTSVALPPFSSFHAERQV